MLGSPDLGCASSLAYILEFCVQLDCRVANAFINFRNAYILQSSLLASEQFYLYEFQRPKIFSLSLWMTKIQMRVTQKV